MPLSTHTQRQKALQSFELILKHYRLLLEDAGKEDSITAVLTELVRSHLFEKKIL
jgi:hypothetical protein